MIKHKTFRRSIVSSTLLISLFIYVNHIDCGSSSNQKNLVNLYTQPVQSLNDDITNIPFLKQFQNGQDRSTNLTTNNKTSILLASPSSSTPTENQRSTLPSLFDQLFEHSSGSNQAELNSASQDNSNQDNNHYPNITSRYDIPPLPSLTIPTTISTSLGPSSNGPGCKGRLRLNGTSGYISDGPSFYSVNLQCIWLIDTGNVNDTIRIQIHRFNTECNYDYLYIFDGDSIYSPMVAALSGDMRDFSSSNVDDNQAQLLGSNYYNRISMQQSFGQDASSLLKPTNGTTFNNVDSMNHTIGNGRHESIRSFQHSYGLRTKIWLPPMINHDRPLEIKTHSGKAFIYFHSDTALIMPGFYMTYTVNACPYDCSDNGHCDSKTLKCKCNQGYHGDSCQHVDCPNNCTSTNHGSCHEGTQTCICNKGFMGPDCSIQTFKFPSQSWSILDSPLTNNNSKIRSNILGGRALHQSVVIGDKLWLLGGKTRLTSDTNITIHRKRKSIMIKTLDLHYLTWLNDTSIEGVTGIDHLAELTGHSAAAYGSKIYIYGGIALNYTILDTLSIFDTQTLTFNIIDAKRDTSGNNGNSGHRGNHDHYSANIFRDLLVDSDKLVAPIASVGHSTNIIDDHMYIFLGFNPIYGYLNYVQKYNLKTGNWSLIEKKGSQLIGCIGHTTSYDPITELVYLYGGHNSRRLSNLYAYDIKSDIWHHLQKGPSPRYYHSALILDRQLIIIGGNSYNTTHPHMDQCFHDSYLIYDLDCTDRSSTSTSPDSSAISSSDSANFAEGFSSRPSPGFHMMSNSNNHRISSNNNNNNNNNDCEPSCWTMVKNQHQPGLLKRHGLSVANYKRNLILTGGFNGLILNDILLLQIGNCNEILDENDCNRPKLAIECSWNLFDSKCENKQDMIVNSSTSSSSISTAASASPSRSGTLMRNTHDSQSKSCAKYFDPQDLLIGLGNNEGPQLLGETPCNQRYSCNICVPSKCIWCSTSEQCLDSSAYFAYHPIGQCMHYVAHPLKCPVASCSDIESCDTCLANPKCGWLNDIGNTGKGKCLEGTSSGPSLGNGVVSHNDEDYEESEANSKNIDANYTTSAPSLLSSLFSLTTGRLSARSSKMLLDQNTSPTMIPNWYYSTCPSCQCNGHSYCKQTSNNNNNNNNNHTTSNHNSRNSNDNNVCVQPCLDNTEGPQCDKCILGYYGDPINGGSCKPCKCNGHAQSCNRETGKCYCSTKGMIGHNCNRCDEQNHYIGDPTQNYHISHNGTTILPGNGVSGTCYYNLTTDFQYTFNMSKTEDHFYSDINFVNIPTRRDSDVDFTIACSKPALINITSGTSYRTRKMLFSDRDCGTIRLRLSPDRSDLILDNNYSFYVHVQKFQTPFVLQISFSQHRTIYLPQVFFTFSSCFLFFFILTGVLWKLKMEYDSYVRRQRQSIEMQQMASRPFSRILLQLFGNDFSSPSKGGMSKVPTSEPTPVAFEPCFEQTNNIGILSVFVQLPGRPNLALGSALVNLLDQGDDHHQQQHQQQQLQHSTSSTNTGSVVQLEPTQKQRGQVSEADANHSSSGNLPLASVAENV